MGIQFLYSFLISLVLSLVIIPFLIRHSARLGLVDDPTGNARKIHSTAIPRSGGLGIILSAAIALLIVLPFDESIFSFVLASLVVIAFGLLDDIVELKPVQKLLGQSIAVAIAMAGGMVIYDFPMWPGCPLWICYTVTFVFVLGVVNGVNFSDGMDGLAAGTSLIAMVVVAILAIETLNTQVAAVSLAVSAALLGFLRFNTHPAGIFMGDAGSQFLGFALAWLAISVSQSETSQITTLIPLLILGIPVMDILQVIPVRIKKKLPLPGPDREHFHHQIAKLGFYQSEVVAIIYVLQAILIGSAYLMRFSSDFMVFAFYTVYATIVLGCLYLAHTSGWRIRPIRESAPGNRRNRLFRSLSALHPYTGKFFGIAVGLCLSLASLLCVGLPANLVRAGVVWGTVLLAVRILSRKRWPLVLGRLASYTATILLLYGMALSITGDWVNWLVDGALALLAILLTLAMRITRKTYFWLNTSDLLAVLFLVMLVSLLPLEFAQDFTMSRLIFRTFVLLYACEYLLARGEQVRDWLTVSSIAALLLLGLHL